MCVCACVCVCIWVWVNSAQDWLCYLQDTQWGRNLLNEEWSASLVCSTLISCKRTLSFLFTLPLSFNLTFSHTHTLSLSLSLSLSFFIYLSIYLSHSSFSSLSVCLSLSVSLSLSSFIYLEYSFLNRPGISVLRLLQTKTDSVSWGRGAWVKRRQHLWQWGPWNAPRRVRGGISLPAHARRQYIWTQLTQISVSAVANFYLFIRLYIYLFFLLPSLYLRLFRASIRAWNCRWCDKGMRGCGIYTPLHTKPSSTRAAILRLFKQRCTTSICACSYIYIYIYI